MKKNNLFKAVGIVLLTYVLLSWIVPIVYSVAGIKPVDGEAISTQVGLISIINVVLETFSGFGGVVLFVLLVGAFYGVLKATGAYDKVLEFLLAKVAGREKCALITTIVVMALVSSVAGLDIGLLIIFPLLIGLFVKMGYDKMVALSATVGATIIGIYGATLAGTLYGINNKALSLDKFSQIAPKVVLFVFGVASLIFLVVKYCENKKLVFDEKSSLKTISIEGIVVFGMGLIASSVLVMLNLMNENVSALWIVLSVFSLLALIFAVLKLSNKNLWTTLIVLSSILFVFALVLTILYAVVQSTANVLWIVLASVLFVALIAFIIVKVRTRKPVKKAAKKGNTKVKKAAVDNRKTIKKVDNKGTKGKERGAIPALVVYGILLLIVILGTTNWAEIFKSNWFDTAHTAWTGVKVGGFPILSKLFGGVGAFGTWLTPTRFQTYSLLLVIAMVALKFIYKTKWEDVFNGFVDGLKSFVVPAILTVLACSVFVCVFYNPFISTVTSKLLLSKFNIVTTSLYTIINSVFYVDYYYLANSLLQNVPSIYSESATLSIISVIFTNLYGLVMLVAPTSVLLLVTLSITDVKYTDWIKFIWKLAISLFVISFIVFIIMMI